MAMAEPLIHSALTTLDPEHPWAYAEVLCVVCGKQLHAADNTCTQVWVETGSGGYCVPDFAQAVDGAQLKSGVARGKPPSLVEALQSVHTPVDTEHGVCCFQCSQTAADSGYRVMYPCPELLKGYEIAGARPPGPTPLPLSR